MERRNWSLLVALVLVWVGWIILQVYFAPAKKPAPPKPAEGEVAQDEAKKAADGDEPAAPAVAEADKPAVPEQPEIAAPLAPQVARQWLALGSADPQSGYSALYFFDNRGAAVERVQLNGPRYASVEDRSGYLGHLGLTDDAAGGVRVNVVGPGTPAALAQATGNVPPGLAVGDVIQTIDGQPVSDAAWVDEYLSLRTRPGQTMALGVKRQDVAGLLTFAAVLARRPVEVVQPESHTYRLPNGLVREDPPDPLSLLVTLDSVGGTTLKETDRELKGLPSLSNSNWTVEQQGPDFVEFSFTLDAAALAKIGKEGALKIVKRYTVTKAEKPNEETFRLGLQVAIHNIGETDQTAAYRLGGPTGLPLEGWWYSTKLSRSMRTGAGARDVVFRQTGMGHELLGGPVIVGNARTAEKADKPRTTQFLKGDAAPFDYVGVDTQFFASVVQPLPTTDNQPIRFRSALAMPVQRDVLLLRPTRLRTADVSFRLSTTATSLKPGASLKHDYQVFFGPKDPGVLARYDLGQLIEYGWPIFAYPAILLRNVLNGLYWLTTLVGLPNYGIAIILLTVIVRTGMIPVSLKQARSAAKMQELAPEVQKIKDKFPDDPMKQHQAVQDLYKKHDFNMFGGCLPVFIQLPIFIGLYRCLSVDIDLRNAPLIPGLQWASNLAGPDKLFRWDHWMPAFLGENADLYLGSFFNVVGQDGWLGPFFNVLPLITVALFLVQQKMFTPPATDEQTRMQQQMMTYMTVFMGVMFYKVPAGLCLYFITSSLWGICERKLLPKPQPKDSTAKAQSSGGLLASLTGKATGANGSSKQAPPRRKQKR